MSIADEWKDFVKHCQCWLTDEAAEREVSDIRKLEANLAEAVALLRHVLMTTDDEEEAREFLARIDAASGKK